MAAVACVDAPAASSPEQRLATRYSPIVALKTQRKICGKGEAYRPVLVDVVLGRADVSLFEGTKGRYRRLRRAPTAADLAFGPFRYYVDLPGHPVTGACRYQHWFRRIGAHAPNAVYAHVATEAGHPGRLALQYWLYYVYNDYNDKHESDWEMLQLHFDADTVEEALRRPPVEVLYSQHEGAERAGWDDDKLEKVGRTHPVTYPGPAHTQTTSATRSGSGGAPEKGSAATTRPPPPRGSRRGRLSCPREPGRLPRLPGSRSKGIGASVSGGSTTGRSARMPTSNGSSRSPGRRTSSETGASASAATSTVGWTRAPSSAPA